MQVRGLGFRVRGLGYAGQHASIKSVAREAGSGNATGESQRRARCGV